MKTASTAFCMFPRYDIGDLVEAAEKNYFRVFGRTSTLTVLEIGFTGRS